ncbi:MAG: formate dehydrogenase accessory sulfurtransferase FdhD [Desulfobacterales bacterium]|nr:formate dehydrogenase accessory sulfurtransferase FdhD [Desulfobacterales bacterium]
MSTSRHTITLWQDAQIRSLEMEILDEEPLAIRVQGQPYAVVMRTPGEELAHAAGFCFTEGIVDRPEDIEIVDQPEEIRQLAACDTEDTNVVTVTLTPERRAAIGGHLARRGFISQTGCGLCGKTVIEEVVQQLPPVAGDVVIPLAEAEKCLRQMDRLQPMRQSSAASHAAAIFDADLNPLAVMEDVGRHNALDKAIGRLFLDRRLHLAKVLMLSSRISYELVQKAARARIPIILALSRPTRLALDLADRLGISLAGAAKPAGLYLYCHPRRFVESRR